MKSIADDLGAPVRVEVHEADGNTFTDIVTPMTTSNGAPCSRPGSDSGRGDGFLPDEEVSVAVILGTVTSTESTRWRTACRPPCWPPTEATSYCWGGPLAPSG